ncbi:MAG: ArnT family glycosyltransferase [Sphingobium sp.]
MRRAIFGPEARFAGLILILMLIALFRGMDHDEGQYVGAVRLMHEGLPFRDFLYLQTPLQPLLFAPMAWIAQGWLYPALRLVNALCAAGAALMTWKSVRLLGGSTRAATLTTLFMACCHSFLFSASLARNDALPLFLNAAGIWLFLLGWQKSGGRERRGVLLLLSGLAFGAAASAKISYAFPAAAAGLFALMQTRRIGMAGLCAFALGGVGGVVPTVLLWWLAPEAAWFGMIDYSLEAPRQWQALNNRAWMAQSGFSLFRLLLFLAQGPALLALAAILRKRFAGHGEEEEKGGLPLFLDMLILAGLLAAWLPRPVYPQYLAPMLPALFVRLGPLLEELWQRRGRRVLFLAAMLIGVAETLVSVLPNLAHGRSPPLMASHTAHYIGCLVGDRKEAVIGLSPPHLVDSGRPFDRRFVTGPFAFRMRGLLTPDEEARFHILQSTGFAAAFDRDPPAAIVVGTERKSRPGLSGGLDALLEQWARARHYKPIPIEHAGLVLYLSDRADGNGAMPSCPQ